MSHKKSKLPDLQEVLGFTTKFLKDVKKSLCEIIEDYKKNHDLDKKDHKTSTKSSKTSEPPKKHTSHQKTKTQKKQPDDHSSV